MKLTKEQIDKYRKIYRNKFGREISHEEAYDSATKLVQLMKVIYRPITQESVDELKTAHNK